MSEWKISVARTTSRDGTIPPDLEQNNIDVENQSGFAVKHTSASANYNSARSTGRGLLRDAGSYNPTKYFPGWATDWGPGLLLFIFACGFGALHCLAWNSPFPTVKEQLAWRICAAATTALPALILLVPNVWEEYSVPRVIANVLLALIVSLYIIGRIALITLAFMAFRALPADAFQTVQWNQYIPHFSG